MPSPFDYLKSTARNAYFNSLAAQAPTVQNAPALPELGHAHGGQFQMPNFAAAPFDWNAWAQAQAHILARAQQPRSFDINGQAIDPYADKNPFTNGFFKPNSKLPQTSYAPGSVAMQQSQAYRQARQDARKPGPEFPLSPFSQILRQQSQGWNSGAWMPGLSNELAQGIAPFQTAPAYIRPGALPSQPQSAPAGFSFGASASPGFSF